MDGDSLEPNECPAQATALSPTAAGSSPVAVSADISPTDADVDWYAVESSPGHTYWILLDASAAMCATTPGMVSAPVAGWAFGTQAGPGDPLSFECQRVSGQPSAPTYRLAVLDFDTAAGDLPDSGTLPMLTSRTMADTYSSSSDLDRFEFQVDLPITLSHIGHDTFLQVEVYDATSGSLLTTLDTECSASLVATACGSITGSGLVRVRVAASAVAWTPPMTAYALTW